MAATIATFATIYQDFCNTLEDKINARRSQNELCTQYLAVMGQMEILKGCQVVATVVACAQLWLVFPSFLNVFH